MPKKSKHPVDSYSREAYEEGLVELANKQSEILAHPLRKEIELHDNLRLEMNGAPYPMVEEEQKLRQQLDDETQHERKAVARIENDLKRQLSNAQREAMEEDQRRDGEVVAAELLPKINEIKEKTEETLKQIGDTNHPANSFGQALIKEANDAIEKAKTEPHTRIGVLLIEFFQNIRELYAKFLELVGSLLSLDRYGKDRMG